MHSTNITMKFSESLENIETREDTDIIKKLRRLQIQENVLSKSIRNTADCFLESDQNEKYIEEMIETKDLVEHLKQSHCDIQQLFDDVKIATTSEDHLEALG